jgi:S-DNA-T family DNA segregation ATPase FtsK/SpoIIIE
LVPKFSKKEGDEGTDSEEEEELEYEDESVEADDNIRSIEFVEGPKEEFVPQVVNESVKEQRVLRANIYSGIDWKLPNYDLLEKNEKKPKLGNLEENADIIKKTLHNFNIEVEKGEYNVGPTVTQYTFKPAVGVKLSKILALQNDLALALAAHPIRIEAPIPGKSLVGVEVPNRTKAMVRMRSMLESEEFQNRPSDLCITLGEDVNGNVIIGNIEKMPHLMIAGSTGTGKSVGINAVLTALLYQNSPEQLRLILVDPKRVELSLYNGIPHLLTPVIVENSKVVNALKWAVGEMERRYRLLQEAGSRDIHSYNEKIAAEMAKQENVEEDEEEQESQMEKIPFIVIVIDELADLMAAHAREVEGLIVRLAQMARAVGIHLIVSTQRPSVEVITGLIKANITTRIAFQVATQIDSRTILDMGGAEKLLGNGDMLYLSADSAQPRRIQGVYISEKEVKKMVDFIKKQADEAEYTHGEDLSGSLEAQLENAMGTLAGSGTEGGKDEVLYEQAKKIAIDSGTVSVSFLQRKMRIGFPRAARLVDMLEENGVIGPQDGSRPRQVLMKAGDTNYDNPAEDQAKRDKWQQ